MSVEDIGVRTGIKERLGPLEQVVIRAESYPLAHYELGLIVGPQVQKYTKKSSKRFKHLSKKT